MMLFLPNYVHYDKLSHQRRHRPLKLRSMRLPLVHCTEWHSLFDHPSPHIPHPPQENVAGEWHALAEFLSSMQICDARCPPTATVGRRPERRCHLSLKVPNAETLRLIAVKLLLMTKSPAVALLVA